MPDTIQTLAAKQNGYPLLFNGYMARFAKLVKDYADSISGTPSHSVKFAGTLTTVGGAADEAWTVTGVAATDLVLVTFKVNGATEKVIHKAVPTTNTITITFDADPGAGRQVTYAVLRAAS